MRYVFLMLLACLVLAGPAEAWTEYPGQRVAHNALLDELVTRGGMYWHARGETPCAAPTVYLASDLTDDDGLNVVGRSIIGGCEIWIRVDIVAAVQNYPGGRYTSAMLCTAVRHELGHTAGLGDSASGVMGGYGDRGCRWWAKTRAKRYARSVCEAHRHPAECARRALVRAAD